MGKELIVSEFPSYFMSSGNAHDVYNTEQKESSLAPNQICLPNDAPDIVRVNIESSNSSSSLISYASSHENTLPGEAPNFVNIDGVRCVFHLIPKDGAPCSVYKPAKQYCR